MEKLSPQRKLAIEKIKKSQQLSSGNTSFKPAKAAKAAKATVTQGDLTPLHEPYFPATKPEFFGTSRPAEAREKSARLIELIKQFNKKYTSKRLVNSKNKNKLRYLNQFAFFNKSNK